MKVLPIQSLFDYYAGISYLNFQTLDVAEFDGFCANSNGILDAKFILLVRSEDEKINNSVLGMGDNIAMLFQTIDDAYSFQNKLCELFCVKFYPVLCD